MDEGYNIIDALTSIGEEVLATKYLSIACATILFYEYFLTFSDEVRYAWRGKKTWVSLLFGLNRYLPIVYKIWDLSYDGRYQYGQLILWNSTEVTSYCTVTTFTENAYLVLVTILSQLFLAMRVYAIKGRSKGSFAILSSLTVVQLAYGVVYAAVFRREAYTLVSLANPEEYTFAICLQDSNGTSLQLGYLAISLGFDVIAFLMIAACSYNSTQMFRSSSLFGRVVQDATVYFLLIVWVHMTVTIYVAKMGVSRILMLFPALTNIVIPVMICRLVLSLRKATDPNVVRAWNVDHFSTHFGTHTQRDGVLLSPLRFQSLTMAATSLGRGTVPENESMIRSATNSSGSGSGWTIDGSGEDESSRREGGHRIP